MSDVLLVITHLPDRAAAERIATLLVTEGAAACVNVMPECTSLYRWQGKLEQVREVPLFIKTARAAYPHLEKRLREVHPHDLPEIIALPVEAGLPSYLEWVIQQTPARESA